MNNDRQSLKVNSDPQNLVSIKCQDKIPIMIITKWIVAHKYMDINTFSIHHIHK